MKSIVVICLLLTSVFAKVPSLEHMISQMLVVGVGGSRLEDKWVQQLQLNIKNDRVGGIILLNKNIESPKKLKKMIASFKKIKVKYPLFIATIQEGGNAQELLKAKGFHSYPSVSDIGKTKNLNEASKIYKNLANELKEYGFNLNFGPVVDLSTKGFSTKAEIVISYANEFLDAQKNAGLISAIKYFPGTGNNAYKSHKKIIDASKSWDYAELKPYYYFAKYDKVRAVIVGHIKLDKFDEKNPASLSKNIINGLLREKLKFKGVVFSDDMLVFQNSIGLKSAVIKAINAGVDVLVFSSYFTQKSSVVKEVTKIIIQAVKNGKIKKATIENSYKRIVRLKHGIN